MISSNKRILAALDGSVTQRKVAEKAVRCASDNKAHLCFAHVIDAVYSEASPEEMQRLAGKVEQDIREKLADVIEEAQADENIQSFQIMVATGALMDCLHHEIVDVFEPDLVICCRRGFSGLHYAFAGSVSTYLIRNMNCDVLVIPND